jgi:DnaK suppressor protein
MADILGDVEMAKGKENKKEQAARKEAVLQLKAILVRRRDALRQALAGDLSLLKELRQQASGDVLDAALDSAQDELSSQLAEVESRELSNIEVALEKMRAGDYGQCEDCSEAIPLARLQALPYATMCIQCQREAEKGGHDYRRRDNKWGADADSEADVEVDA